MAGTTDKQSKDGKKALEKIFFLVYVVINKKIGESFHLLEKVQ